MKVKIKTNKRSCCENNTISNEKEACCDINEIANNRQTCCDENCCVDDVGEMVKKLVRVFQLFERDEIKPFEVTTSQCYCLLALNESSELNMYELSEKLNLDTSTVTRLADKLVRDGLVLRKREEDDRRIVTAALTEMGKEKAEQLSKSINEYYKRIIANIPEGQLNNVLNSVTLVLNAFEMAKNK